MRTVALRGVGRCLLPFLLFAVFMTACGGDPAPTNPIPPGPNPETPAFTLSVSSGSLTIDQGASGSVTVTIARSGGLTAGITVTVEGLPQGVTAGALTIATGSTTGTLTLTAAEGAQTGNASLTIRGTAPGADAKTASLTLTVNAVAQPDFSISLDPGSLSIQAGQEGTSTVAIARTGGFTGAVALTVSGLPAGVAGSFDPASTTGTTSTLTLATEAEGPAAAATPGDYTLTVTGTGEGLGGKTATLALEITSPPPPVGNTTWEFCESSGLPEWVAVQDGDGAWTRATGTNGSFTFAVNSDRGGVAWVHSDGGDGFTLEIFFGAKEELATFGEDRCGGSPGTGKTITASVPGLATTDITVLTLGGSLPDAAPTFASPGITFRGVRNGTVDLMGGRSSINLGTLQITPQRFLIQRGLNPAGGSSLGTIDFTGEHSFDPTQNTLTVNNAGGQSIITTTNYSTGGTIFGNLAVGIGGSGTSWFGVPEGRQESNDLHILTVTAASLTEALAPSQTTVRMVRAAGAVTVDLGPQLSMPTVQPLAGTGHARARAEYPIQAEYHRYWLANFQQSGPFRAATIQMTSAYRGSQTGTASLEIPEFAGVDGWDTQWGLRTGGQVTWTVSGIGWTDAGGIVSPPFTDGNSFTTASRMGQFTP